ncbi:MAG: hypothetical protein LH629_11070, partial [Ignavibacteria bacterium]|nr:hypothetical protein [Ignavibacteria bacterium]
RRLTEWKKRAEKSSKVNEQAAISKIGEAQAKYDLLMSEAKSVQEKMMAGKTNKDEKKLKEGELLDNKVESDEEILSRIMAELFVVFGKTDEFDAAVIAEAQGKFQGITDKANSNVGSRISKLTQFNLLSNEEVVAARKLLVEEGKGPWLYYANYGKAIERLADNYVMGSPEFQSITKNANNPDFERKKGSKYEGLVFDITTSNGSTIDAHVRRTKDPKKSANYKNVIITSYERVITVQSELINKMDANIE